MLLVSLKSYNMARGNNILILNCLATNQQVQNKLLLDIHFQPNGFQPNGAVQECQVGFRNSLK